MSAFLFGVSAFLFLCGGSLFGLGCLATRQGDKDIGVGAGALLMIVSVCLALATLVGVVLS